MFPDSVPPAGSAQHLLAALLAPDPGPTPLSPVEQLLATGLLASQFAYVYDVLTQDILFVSAGIERLLGERPDAARLDLSWFATRLHPADAATVVQAQALVQHYLLTHAHAPLPDFLFSLDYRLRHADGRYRRVLHQTLLLERAPDSGPVRRLLALCTDITHHKLTPEVRWHVNQPDFTAFAQQQQQPAAVILTARERQVLALVLEGLTSRQIAHRLGLTEFTAKTHRRNLLRKAGTGSFHRLLELLQAPAQLSFNRCPPYRGGATGGAGRSCPPCGAGCDGGC